MGPARFRRRDGGRDRITIGVASFRGRDGRHLIVCQIRPTAIGLVATTASLVVCPTPH